MSKKRSYHEACPVSHALDLVGERWALLVVRELMLGPKRFGDLQAGLCGISSNILTMRLRELEEIGVLRRYRAGVPVSSPVYELTDWGRGLEPVLMALGAWAAPSPFLDRHAPSSLDSMILGLRARALMLFAGAAPVPGRCELRVDGDRVELNFGAGGMEIARVPVVDPDATVATDRETFQALLVEDLTLDEAVADDRVTLGGDERLIRSVIK